MTNATIDPKTMPEIILDTDLGGDIDDLGALAVLHALADQGRCSIAGMVSDTGNAAAVNAIRAVNRWYGRPDLVVARPAAIREVTSYAAAVAAGCPDLPPPDTAPTLPTAYRRMLAATRDGAAVIVTVGFLEHLCNLLESGPDAECPLTGRELVRRKVRRIVTMGGGYPDGVAVRGTDPNFEQGTRACARRAIEACPVPMTFCGMELGARSRGYATGVRLLELPEEHPLHVGYTYFFQHPPAWVKAGPWPSIQPWSIWDQIAVYEAVCQDRERFREIRGRNELDDESRNRFQEGSDGPHVYLTPVVAPETIARDVIEPLMLTRPLRAG